MSDFDQSETPTPQTELTIDQRLYFMALDIRRELFSLAAEAAGDPNFVWSITGRQVWQTLESTAESAIALIRRSEYLQGYLIEDLDGEQAEATPALAVLD